MKKNYILTLFFYGAVTASYYPLENAHKITPISAEHLVKPENADNGYGFEMDWDMVKEFVYQADAGGVGDDTTPEQVAKCKVILTDGEETYMNLARIITDKRTFYVKDISGCREKFEIWMDGATIVKEPKKKGRFGRLFG